MSDTQQQQQQQKHTMAKKVAKIIIYKMKRK